MEDVLTNIRKIFRSLNLESKRIQKEHGISIPQLLTLRLLEQAAQYQLVFKDIVAGLNLNKSTVTGIINRLEKKGLAARLPKQGDKRTTIIALTSKGVKLLSQIPEPLHEKLAGKLKSLPEDQAETIRKGLEYLVLALDIEDVDASPLLTIDEKPE